MGKEEVVSKIKEIALGFGVAEDQLDAFAEKCYMDIPSWKPYGGATSFSQIDQQRAVREFSYAIDEQTNELRGIINNVTDSDDFSTEEKAAAITDAATEYRSRVGKIPVPTAAEAQADPDLGEEGKGLVDHVKDALGIGKKRDFNAAQRKKLSGTGAAMPDGSFPIANVSDLKNAIQAIGRAKNPAAAKAHIKRRARALGATNLLPDGWKEGISEGFKVFQDKEGNYRWLSFSSNAFEDNQKELFTTAALEEAVIHADKTGERGPLLYFHVKSAEIGQCDFQAVQGRFLVESGTFNDTPIGQKALEYLLNTDEEQQVSIGYKYRLGDELDGQYDWFRFNERSVLPAGLAANNYTQFLVLGGEEDSMNPVKEAKLKEVFGEEMTKDIISAADSKTKELEEAGVRHKEAELQTAAFGDITGERRKEVPETEVLEHEHGDVIHTHVVESGKTHLHGEGVAYKANAKKPMDPEDKMDKGADEDTEDAQGKKKPMGKKEDDGLLAALEDLGAKISKMDDEIKELKKTEDERFKEMVSPRTHNSEGERPSESSKNEITEDEINFLPAGMRDQLKEVFSDKSKANPASMYAAELMHGLPAAE